MSFIDHKKDAPESVGCMIITVSDTRTDATDKSGKLMWDLLEVEGHKIILYQIVKDDQQSIKDAIIAGCEHPQVEVILTNGGTGISKRDVTIETVQSIMSKEMVGFGEIFRMLSYTEDIGSAAILSRAIAGIVHDKAIFSTPGSTGAVKLAMNRLILPEIGHVVREIKKDLE
ncbi:MogA/MoaB family molybdenum cofactor biosynthesis protein [Peribacillus alkalitolerans]|uniref:MogA/MoaB family molybdenum cofactor biosynthesis protein n=1 Tax=Peribacillus alkalitolerans TaxID=1550385 RepID=UPI0013D12245|nr:molybdenum cofactor biosynthesis protein B [Peribacillus alkalitolerans]